jgi:hypothetical protein
MNEFSKRTSKCKKTKNDVVYTPIPLVLDHLNRVKKFIREGDVIYDPFYGEGAYFENYEKVFTKNNTFVMTEIALGTDFFDYDEPVDAIVSNPPYSKLGDIINKAISLKPRVISLLIGILNIQPRRFEALYEAGYKLRDMYNCEVDTWFATNLALTFVKDNDDSDNCSFGFSRERYRGYK